MEATMIRHRVESGERRPDLNMTALIVTGDSAGAIIAVSLVVLGWIGIPEARPFLLGSVVLGSVFGLILWWKHR
jgi:acetyl esterase/lipase